MIDIRYNVDLSEYHADTLLPQETLSHSVAKQMLISCKHGWAAHPRFGGHPKPVTFSMKLGTILDEVLTNECKRLKLMEHAEYRTNAAKADRDAALAAGLVPVKKHELQQAQERAESVLTNLRYHGIDMEDGWQKQVCILWDESASNGNKVQCRALLDWFHLGSLIRVRDLKSAKSARPGEALNRTMIANSYHLQAVAYTRAVEAVFPDMAGRVVFENLLVETEWPFEPLLTEFDGACRELGRVQWQEAVDRWEECTRTGKWPGYMKTAQPYTVQLPAYMQADIWDDTSSADETETEEEDSHGRR
jgi:hypothetical protein